MVCQQQGWANKQQAWATKQQGWANKQPGRATKQQAWATKQQAWAKRVKKSTMIAMLLLSGCGSGSNLNQIFGGDDKGGDSLLIKARLAYDQGDFARAQDYANQLVAINPDNEEAAVLYGFATMSSGGIDPFRVAKQLINLATSTTSSTTAKLAQSLADLIFAISPNGNDEPLPVTLADSTTSSSSSDDGGASKTLRDLAKALLTLTDADMTSLTNGKFSKTQNGNVEPQLFINDSALLVPKTIDDTLRASVPVLDAMNKSIKSVCRFIDTSIKVKDDDRDQLASCVVTSAPRRNVNKSAFLWAFTHLTEALVYQSVILYTGGGSTPSIEKATTVINGANVSSAAELTAFALRVNEAKNAIDTVFDTSSKNSMITAAINSLNEVSNAFTQMSGLPDSVTKSVQNAFAGIQKLGKTLSGASSSASNVNTLAFKSQMTASLGKSIGSKLDAAADQAAQKAYNTTYSKLTDAQKADVQKQVSTLCDTFTNLTKGQTVTKPTVCP